MKVPLREWNLNTILAKHAHDREVQIRYDHSMTLSFSDREARTRAATQDGTHPLVWHTVPFLLPDNGIKVDTFANRSN
jgi:hypothetical protein